MLFDGVRAVAAISFWRNVSIYVLFSIHDVKPCAFCKLPNAYLELYAASKLKLFPVIPSLLSSLPVVVVLFFK